MELFIAFGVVGAAIAWMIYDALHYPDDYGGY